MYTCQLVPKEKGAWCLLKSDIQRFGGSQFRTADTDYDLKKIKAIPLKNARVHICKVPNRAEYLKALKSLYPNYTMKQLNEIGFYI